MSLTLDGICLVVGKSKSLIMKVIDTEIEGVKIVDPDMFGDARGWFCETYNAERYR